MLQNNITKIMYKLKRTVILSQLPFTHGFF